MIQSREIFFTRWATTANSIHRKYKARLTAGAAAVLAQLASTKKKLVSYNANDEVLFISQPIVDQIQGPTIQRIVEYVRDAVEKPELNITTVYLCGGFSKSPFLYKAVQDMIAESKVLKAEGRRVTLQRPHQPGTAVCSGAVHYALNREIIECRVINTTIGYQIAKIEGTDYDPVIDADEKIQPVIVVSRGVYAKSYNGYFQRLCERGKRIMVGEVKTERFHAADERCSKILIQFYQSNSNSPRTIYEDGVRPLGRVYVPTRGSYGEIHMRFGGTEIVAEVVDDQNQVQVLRFDFMDAAMSDYCATHTSRQMEKELKELNDEFRANKRIQLAKDKAEHEEKARIAVEKKEKELQEKEKELKEKELKEKEKELKAKEKELKDAAEQKRQREELESLAALEYVALQKTKELQERLNALQQKAKEKEKEKQPDNKASASAGAKDQTHVETDDAEDDQWDDTLETDGYVVPKMKNSSGSATQSNTDYEQQTDNEVE
jgi:hypothetical protein